MSQQFVVIWKTLRRDVVFSAIGEKHVLGVGGFELDHQLKEMSQLFGTPCPLFLTYLSRKHSYIKFTSIPETNNSLAFLDVHIKRLNNRFSCNVFRKPTFSGLGTSLFSYYCKKVKTNSVLTLLSRAYAICSNYNLLHEEF